MKSLSIHAWVRWVGFLPVLAVWLAVGCGPPPMGEVSGVVTYNGEPLPSGTIGFMNDGVPNRYKAVSALILDGRYTVPKVACGDVRISVSTPPNSRFSPSIPIPKQYNDLEKSGLSYKVEPGSQTFDIKLSGPKKPSPPKAKLPSMEEKREKQRMEMKKKLEQK